MDTTSTTKTGDADERHIAPAGKKPHLTQNSGHFEWYTPRLYVEAARTAMGSIDCDPASCVVANEVVRAPIFYTKEQDGLSRPWRGNVWLNPPYARKIIGRFVEAVVAKHASGEIAQSVVLVNNATDTSWCQLLLGACSAVCLVRGRIKFTGPKMGSPPRGQAVFYLGSALDALTAVFGALGTVLPNLRPPCPRATSQGRKAAAP